MIYPLFYSVPLDGSTTLVRYWHHWSCTYPKFSCHGHFVKEKKAKNTTDFIPASLENRKVTLLGLVFFGFVFGELD